MGVELRCQSSKKVVLAGVGATVVASLVLLALVDQGLVNVRDHTTTSNGSLDECVQLLVSTNRQLKMARGDTLHLKVLGRVTGQLQHLGSEVLQDGSAVHS